MNFVRATLLPEDAERIGSDMIYIPLTSVMYLDPRGKSLRLASGEWIKTAEAVLEWPSGDDFLRLRLWGPDGGAWTGGSDQDEEVEP